MAVESNELVEAVRQVLRRAHVSKDGRTVGFLTAQQILQDLPEELQERLEEEYSVSLARSVHPVVRVARSASEVTNIQVEWLDTRSLGLKVLDEAHMGPGGPSGPGLVGLYRLPPSASTL